MSHIALVVPCYDEESRLDVAALRGACLPGHDLELLLVDDGSRDATRAVLESIAKDRPRTSVLSLERNAGKAEAVRRGVVDALGRNPGAVGFWDADLATPLAELADFVTALESDPEVDIVIGSRVKLMGRAIERRRWRHYSGRIFATAAAIALDLPVYDTQCGSKLFRVTPLLPRVFEQPFLARWVFDVEILARFLAYDARGPGHVARSLVELPLHRWVDVAGSKVRAIDFARSAADLARIRLAYPRQPPSRA